MTARFEHKMETLENSMAVTVSFALHMKGILVMSSDDY